ncbi:hypothetical protein D3C84_781060 [compost metagenome]
MSQRFPRLCNDQPGECIRLKLHTAGGILKNARAQVTRHCRTLANADTRAFQQARNGGCIKARDTPYQATIEWTEHINLFGFNKLDTGHAGYAHDYLLLFAVGGVDGDDVRQQCEGRLDTPCPRPGHRDSSQQLGIE